MVGKNNGFGQRVESAAWQCSLAQGSSSVTPNRKFVWTAGNRGLLASRIIFDANGPLLSGHHRDPKLKDPDEVYTAVMRYGCPDGRYAYEGEAAIFPATSGRLTPFYTRAAPSPPKLCNLITSPISVKASRRQQGKTGGWQLKRSLPSAAS